MLILFGYFVDDFCHGMVKECYDLNIAEQLCRYGGSYLMAGEYMLLIFDCVSIGLNLFCDVPRVFFYSLPGESECVVSSQNISLVLFCCIFIFKSCVSFHFYLFNLQL